MKLNKWMSIGASAALVGAIVLGLAHASSGVVSAGNISPTASPRSTSTPEPTETPGRIKTHTPTATATEAPKTATPVPPTVAPTNTPKPTGGNESVSVKPPNTGSGDGLGSSAGSSWMLVLGALLVMLGGAAALVGVRRR